MSSEYDKLTERISQRVLKALTEINTYCGPVTDKYLVALARETAERIWGDELQLKQKWSDDIAGPDWQRYSYWRTPTESHPGPSRIAAGLS